MKNKQQTEYSLSPDFYKPVTYKYETDYKGRMKEFEHVRIHALWELEAFMKKEREYWLNVLYKSSSHRKQ